MSSRAAQNSLISPSQKAWKMLWEERYTSVHGIIINQMDVFI